MARFSFLGVERSYFGKRWCGVLLESREKPKLWAVDFPFTNNLARFRMHTPKAFKSLRVSEPPL